MKDLLKKVFVGTALSALFALDCTAATTENVEVYIQIPAAIDLGNPVFTPVPNQKSLIDGQKFGDIKMTCYANAAATLTVTHNGELKLNGTGAGTARYNLMHTATGTAINGGAAANIAIVQTPVTGTEHVFNTHLSGTAGPATVGKHSGTVTFQIAAA